MKFSLAVLIVLFLPYHGEDWELKKDKEGIQLYTKKLEGSTLKAVKAHTTFHAPLETCIAVLRDIKHLNDLFPDSKNVEKVEQTDTSQIHYVQLDAPWPVADRDGAFALRYSYDAVNRSAIVIAEMTSGKYPEQDGFVRLDKGGGKWIFTRLDDEHTELEYYYHGDPGGNIPAWLANSVVEENPYRMLQNFHQLVKLERYQGKTFAFMQ